MGIINFHTKIVLLYIAKKLSQNPDSDIYVSRCFAALLFVTIYIQTKEFLRKDW